MPEGSEQGLTPRCVQDTIGRFQVIFMRERVTYWYGIPECHIRLALGGKRNDPNKTPATSNDVTCRRERSSLNIEGSPL